MSTEVFLFMWALGAALGFLFILGVFAGAAARERHWANLKQEADEAAERQARNRTLPKNGKVQTIWK